MIDMFGQNMAALPVVLALLGAIITLCLTRWPVLQKIMHLIFAVMINMLLVVMACHVFSTATLVLRVGGFPSGIAISFVIDGLSMLMLLVSGFSALAVVIYSWADKTISNLQWFIPIFWFMMAGIFGVFTTSDLFNLYVWFEVMIAASFGLMLLSCEKKLLEGSLYYVSMNLFATMLMLLGVGLVYGLCGTLDFASLASIYGLHQYDAIYVAIMLVLAFSFAAKAALFPMYFWLPASYHLTSISAAAIFAALLTKAGVYALFRLLTLFLHDNLPVHQLLLWISVITMLLGVMGAMSQYHIRRILSFHIISQVGYMTLGIALASPLAIIASVFYIIHHIVVKSALFLVSGIITLLCGEVNLKQMGSLFRHKMILSILFLIPAMSLAGLPPFSGFWAKLLLMGSLISAKEWWPLLASVVAGFMTLYSMMKIWRLAFLHEESDQPRTLIAPYSLYIASALLVLATVLIGLMPFYLYQLAEQASVTLVDWRAYAALTKGVG